MLSWMLVAPCQIEKNPQSVIMRCEREMVTYWSIARRTCPGYLIKVNVHRTGMYYCIVRFL